MEYDSDKQRLFSRRAVLLGGGQALLLSALVGRMYYLQVVQSHDYQILADENRISLRLLAPPRGRIFDRRGTVLAANRLSYRIVMIPEETDDPAATLAALSLIIPISKAQQNRILRQVSSKPSFVPATVVEDLPWDRFSRVNIKSPGLAGIQPGAGETRNYPDNSLFSHVVGYVGAPDTELADDDPLLRLPGFKTGKSGIEKSHEKDLRGRAGTSRVEVNAYGRVIREVARQEGEAGADLVLTVDRQLQDFAARRLAEQSAAVVAMDAHSGDILALVSNPSFDANAFNRGLSRRYWQGLLDDPRKPLINKCIAGQYPPGSTIKPLVALAGLESGAIDEDHEVYCNGALKFGDNVFHCWKKHGHGRVGLAESIIQSCDIFYYDVARRVGIDRLSEFLRWFGLGENFNIGIDGGKAGLVPDRQWKKKTFGTSWQQGETLITGIGQGSLLATPLQMAVMMARIVNGGVAVSPRLMEAGDDRRDPVSAVLQIPVRAAYLRLVQDAMDKVVNDRHGTAFRSRLRKSPFSFGGKSGTAQVIRISSQEREAGVRKNKEKPWVERDHALFVGFGPVEAPRYVVSVLVEHGGGGSSVAGPIVRDMMGEILAADPSASPLFQAPAGNPRLARKV